MRLGNFVSKRGRILEAYFLWTQSGGLIEEAVVKKRAFAEDGFLFDAGQ